mmetsp:Transcript_53746/g.172273  ORF Transcript_53746/g.172273 Transcript_53746/m.172273 type:complete len:276 (+) Transcript_53746:334-1161(+)
MRWPCACRGRCGRCVGIVSGRGGGLLRAAGALPGRRLWHRQPGARAPQRRRAAGQAQRRWGADGAGGPAARLARGPATGGDLGAARPRARGGPGPPRRLQVAGAAGPVAHAGAALPWAAGAPAPGALPSVLKLRRAQAREDGLALRMPRRQPRPHAPARRHAGLRPERGQPRGLRRRRLRQALVGLRARVPVAQPRAARHLRHHGADAARGHVMNIPLRRPTTWHASPGCGPDMQVPRKATRKFGAQDIFAAVCIHECRPDYATNRHACNAWYAA